MPRDKSTTYRIMSAVKSKDTGPEILLGKTMWKLGLRYRKHYKMLGHPDFVFVKAKTVVFCDGDYWHGHNWAIRGLASLETELAAYSPYWREKIIRNVERDKQVTGTLREQGWAVLRFWESEINTSPEVCAKTVLVSVRKGRNAFC